MTLLGVRETDVPLTLRVALCAAEPLSAYGRNLGAFAGWSRCRGQLGEALIWAIVPGVEMKAAGSVSSGS